MRKEFKGKKNYVCKKCKGTGFIKQYSHVQMGQCFKCFGSGKINTKAYSRYLRVDEIIKHGNEISKEIEMLNCRIENKYIPLQLSRIEKFKNPKLLTNLLRRERIEKSTKEEREDIIKKIQDKLRNIDTIETRHIDRWENKLSELENEYVELLKGEKI